MDTIDKLKEFFRQALAEPVDLACYEGGDWWQLDPAEAFVFGLEVADMPALIAAWELFEAIADMTHNDFHDSPLCIKARAALPYIKQDGAEDVQAWEKFARLLGIRGRKARAWFHKYGFALDRDGLAEWSDDNLPMPRARELPAPTHAPVVDQAPASIAEQREDDGIPF